jgi:hypothetical protein
MKTNAFGTFLLATTVLVSPAWAAINAADFGVSASSSDNAAALQRAFDAARGTSDRTVNLPGGTIAYGRQLTADGVRVSGSGNTVLAPSDPRNQRITLTGNSPSLSNVRINYHPVARSGSDHGRNGVWVERATNFNVSGVTLDGAAYGTPPQGQGAGDLFVYNSQGGTISNNNISYTWADSIHMTGGSRNITVTGNRIDHSGDDGIAAVNYGDGTGGVRISGNTVTDNLWGRGVTAVGASDVQITDNMISGNSANLAGVYVASEPAYHTPAPRNVLVEGNTVQDTGGAGPGHGQIMLWSGNGAVSGVTIRDNEVRNSERPDLAVVVSGPTNGVTMEGNQIDGQISTRNGGSYNGSGNTTNDASMANGVTVPAGTPTPAPGGGGSGGPQSQLGQNLTGVERNLYDTDDAFWSAVESGDAEATRRLNDLVSGGILFRQGNQIINRVTGQVTSTVNRTIGNAIDTVMQPVEDTVSSLGDAIICRIGGGWVSALIGINVCAAKQLKIQGRQLETQQHMIESIGTNAVAVAGSVSAAVLGSLGLMRGADVDERYQTGASADMTPDESLAYREDLRTRTDQARRQALETAAMNVEAEQEYSRMADEALALSQSAPGQTAALQALAQLERAKEGAASTRASTQVALEHARLMAEEEDRAGERLALQRRDRLYRRLDTEGTASAQPFQMFQ